MKVQPRKTIVALALATTLLVGTTAGSCGSPEAGQPVDTGGNSVEQTEEPDCDLGDMIEGDSDCDSESETDKKHRKSKEKAKKSAPTKQLSKPRSVFGGNRSGRR